MNIRYIFRKGIRGLYFYIIGQIIAIYGYDKSYLSGRWFKGRFGGICAQGWEWVVQNKRSCRIMNTNKNVPWPVSPNVHIINPENITFCTDDLNNFQSFGIYLQAIEKITLGEGTYIAPNVGIITANHTIGDLNKHDVGMPVTIGKNCWLGMNSVILPGVTLGDNTIVGAGTIVTKSFPKGNCVLVGNPARILRYLDDSTNIKQ